SKSVCPLCVQLRPLTRVAWLLITLGIGIGVGLTTFGIAILGIPMERVASIRGFGDAPLPILALILSQVIFLPSLAGSATLLLLLFPTDRLAGPRWRWVAVLFVLGSLLYTVGLVLRVGDLDPDNLPGVPNPLAGPAALAS